MKKFLSLILCITIALFAVACKPGDDGDASGVTADGKVVISIPIGWGGGGGQAGTEAIAKKFSEDPEFGGKARGNYTGAVVKITEGAVPKTASGLSSTAFDILGFSHGAPLISELAGGCINLSDPYGDGSYDLFAQKYKNETKTLNDKISSNYREYFQVDGSYYGAPATEMYCGISLYTELWEREQLYIAASKVDGDSSFDTSKWAGYHSFHSDKFGVTIYFSDYDGEGGLCYGYESGDNSECLRNGQFSDSPYATRSVGPDGIPGNRDDGQPSTVLEFLAICEYLNSGAIKNDPRPGQGRGNAKQSYYDAVAYSGANKTGYDALFMDAFFASLAGEDYNTVLTLDSEGKEIEVVTGFTNDNLFPGVDDIKKPTTTKVAITPDCGYYASWMVDKYYTDAVMEVLIKGTGNGSYFYYGTGKGSTHTGTQYDFIIGNYNNNMQQEACAYMIDGSYMYAEARANNKLLDVELMFDSATDIRIEYASLPVNFSEPVVYDEVTETSNGDMPSLVVIGKAFQVISKRVAQDPDKLAYCLDWLLYSRGDVNMAEHFMYNSTPFVLADNIPEIIENNPTSGLSTHQYYGYFNKQLLDLHAQSRIYRPIGGEEINPYNAPNYYKRGFGSGIFYIGAREDAYSALNDEGSKETFKKQAYSKTTWNTMYTGTITGSISDAWLA